MKKDFRIKLIGCLTTFSIIGLSFKQNDTNSLVGQWRPYMHYGSDGGHRFSWKSPDSGKFLQFNVNGTISGTLYRNGLTYKIKRINYVDIVDKKIIQEYQFEIKKDTLYLSPTKILCKEGCSESFVKVKISH